MSNSLVSYFARNKVASNLLMAFFLFMGLFTWQGIQKQLFSTADIPKLSLYAELPGASAQEVEESITIKIEESLKGIPEITRYYSDTGNGFAYFTVELDIDVDIEATLNDVKRRLDAVATFPTRMEPIRVDKYHWNQDLIRLVIVADLPTEALKKLSQEVRDELLQLQNIELVFSDKLPGYEIAIELDPVAMRRYQITMQSLAEAINGYSKNQSSGQIKLEAGELVLRLDGQSYTGESFANIPLFTGENGEQVYLGDIADVRDGFIEQQRSSRFNGQTATWIHIFATASQSMTLAADSVHQYVQQKNASLPAGMQLQVFTDTTVYLDDRIDMMLSNLVQGAILVFIMLLVFLRFNVAMWVMLGVPVVFLGTVFLMPFFNIPINVTSLFAFIMTLGIVVDDAIVIGESVYDYSNKHGHSTQNVIKGTLRVATPVTFGVLTTAAVFMPLLFATGSDAGDFIDLSTVVILCLALSLLESKLILPAHLAQHPWRADKKSQWRERIDNGLNKFIDTKYQPLLERCLNNKFTVVSAFVAFAMISISLLTAGWVKEVYMPSVAADTMEISVDMHTSVTQEQTLQTQILMEQYIQEVDAEIKSEFGSRAIGDVLSYISEQGSIAFTINLLPESERSIDAFDISKRMYPLFASLPGIKSVDIVDEAINSNSFNGIGYRFYSPSLEDVNAATLAFIDGLKQLEGINSISSSVKPSVREINFTLLPYAEAMGLTPASVANQINYALYGIEAQRINRDGNDIRVMVRYPKDFREHRSSLNYIRIQTPDGGEVMLGDIVKFHEKQGVNKVRREKGYRSALVIADVADNANIQGIYDHIYSEIFPKIKADYPSVTTDISAEIAEQQQQKDQMLLFGIIGIMLVYILLAIPLQSYTQPLIIMAVIPFSLLGGVWGHWILGHELSLFSQFGMIAAAGVVINASLVLISAINNAIKEGMQVNHAIIFGANSRLRAIMLTSVTTFVGLLPIMMETSVQGRYVAPMAISISFSLLISTLVTLTLIPVFFQLHHNVRHKITQMRANRAEKAATEKEQATDNMAS